MSEGKFYQHCDNIFPTTVRGGDENENGQGTVIPAGQFSNAEYTMKSMNGDVLIQKTLGDGITVEGDDFVTHLDDAEMTFAGSVKHQFIVFDQAGNRLPPVFYGKEKVNPTIKGDV